LAVGALDQFVMKFWRALPDVGTVEYIRCTTKSADSERGAS